MTPARALRIAAMVGALLGASRGTAGADGPEGVSLFPRTSQARAGAEVETASFRLDGRRGAYASAIGRVEWVPLPLVELRARVPVHTLALEGEETTRDGLGDSELRLRFHVVAREPLQISAGWLTQLPTGSNRQGLGGGALQVTPFVNAGFRASQTVFYLTLADAVTVAAPHHTRYADYVDPSSDHELRATLGAIFSFSDRVAASLILTSATELAESRRGRSVLAAAAQLGTQPDRRLRLVLTPQVPVKGEHRFEWKLNATASYAF